MMHYSKEPRTRKCVIWMFVIHEKFGTQILDTATKTELDVAKVVHKTAEATEELTGNKIAEKPVKPKHKPDENSQKC